MKLNRHKQKMGLCIMDTNQALKRPEVADTTATGSDSSHTTPSTKGSDSTHMHSGGALPHLLLPKWVMIFPSYPLPLTKLTQINHASYSSRN